MIKSKKCRVSAFLLLNGITYFSYAQTCTNSGIGVLNPVSKLEIKGCTADSTKSALHVKDSSGASLFFIQNNGKLGVNTINPQANLHLKGSGSTSASVNFLLQNVHGWNLFKVQDGGDLRVGNTWSGGNIVMEKGLIYTKDKYDYIEFSPVSGITFFGGAANTSMTFLGGIKLGYGYAYPEIKDASGYAHLRFNEYPISGTAKSIFLSSSFIVGNPDNQYVPSMAVYRDLEFTLNFNNFTNRESAFILSTGSSRIPILRMNAAGTLGINNMEGSNMLTIKGLNSSIPALITTANNSTFLTIGTYYNDSKAMYDFGVGDKVSVSSNPNAYATIIAFNDANTLTTDAPLGNGSNQTLNVKRALQRWVKADNSLAGIVNDEGNFGIGVLKPTTKFHIKDGHIRSEQTTAPGTSVTEQNGITAAVISTGTTDIKGNITTTGTNNGTGETQITITFNSAYTTAPIVVITAANANARDCKYYVTSSTTSFTLNFINGSSGPSFNYQVIE